MYPYRAYVYVKYEFSDAFAVFIKKYFRKDHWKDGLLDDYGDNYGRPFDFYSKRKFIRFLNSLVDNKSKYKLEIVVYGNNGETMLNVKKVLENSNILDNSIYDYPVVG